MGLKKYLYRDFAIDDEKIISAVLEARKVAYETGSSI